MKRSKKAALLLMTPIAISVLAGCNEKPIENLVFKTPEECAASSSLTLEQCKAEQEKAKVAHAVKAPKYANKAECEADFGVGKCETAPDKNGSASSFFMPMMMGYMMGKMFNNNAGFANSAAAAPAQQKPATSTTRRSGFGSSSRSRMSSGG